MTHTCGSHCPPEWSSTAGSWFNDPCYCDRVQAIANTAGATGNNPQVSLHLPFTNNANAANPAVFTYSYEWIVPSNPAPIHIHYCQHEKINKNLLNLIERLVDRIVTSERLKTGTQPESPVKEKETRGTIR